MVGATGPRMLRLTAELADHWNGGLRAIDEVPALLADLADACAAVGRDPGSMTRSVEVLVRPGDVAGVPAEDREIRGSPATIAAALQAFAALGIDELQVQLRPNSLAGVEAFAPVIEALRSGG
jgi:alkanesulfonate monooxygenase SsuD/methylene tetrahydromethanopterin reductase-like flavin-dependent oxidoreductase (luciferase family)